MLPTLIRGGWGCLLRWCGLGLLVCLTVFGTSGGSVQAQTSTPMCYPYYSCFAATSYAKITATAAANQTSTGVPHTPTPIGTMPDWGIFVTAQPTGTPGVNYNCPDEPFEVEGLDPGWAFVCRPCIDEMVGTATPPMVVPTVATGFVIPTYPPIIVPDEDDTETPVGPTNTPPPSTGTFTPTFTPTPTATVDTGWEWFFDFTEDEQGFSGIFNEDFCPANPAWHSVYDDGVGWGGNAVGADMLICHWLVLPTPEEFPQLLNITMYYDGYGGTNGFDGVSTIIYYEGEIVNILGDSNPNTVDDTASITNLNSGDGVWLDAIGMGGNVSSSDNSGFRFTGLYLAGLGCNPFNGECNPATPTPTPTPSATATPSTATATLGAGTTFPNTPHYGLPPGVVSMDCSNPKYIDGDFDPGSVDIVPSGTNVCFTVLPRFFFGFDLVESIINVFSGQDVVIPDLSIPWLELCFYGFELNLTLWGLSYNLNVVLLLFMGAFLFRWVMRQ